MHRSLVAGLATLALASTAAHAAAPPPFQGLAMAQDRVLSRAIGRLQVTLPALQPDGSIPVVNSGYGKSTSFPISWAAAPRAQAYAVVVEDPDGKGPQPVLHWLAYNIPPEVTSLGKSVRNRAVIGGAKGFMQGRNSRGGIGYVGPHPPENDPPHHYHVQVFALSSRLAVGGGADLDQVVLAMNDKVLAEGEAVATFQWPLPNDAKTKAKR